MAGPNAAEGDRARPAQGAADNLYGTSVAADQTVGGLYGGPFFDTCIPIDWDLQGIKYVDVKVPEDCFVNNSAVATSTGYLGTQFTNISVKFANAGFPRGAVQNPVAGQPDIQLTYPCSFTTTADQFLTLDESSKFLFKTPVGPNNEPAYVVPTEVGHTWVNGLNLAYRYFLPGSTVRIEFNKLGETPAATGWNMSDYVNGIPIQALHYNEYMIGSVPSSYGDNYALQTEWPLGPLATMGGDRNGSSSGYNGLQVSPSPSVLFSGIEFLAPAHMPSPSDPDFNWPAFASLDDGILMPGDPLVRPTSFGQVTEQRLTWKWGDSPAQNADDYDGSLMLTPRLNVPTMVQIVARVADGVNWRIQTSPGSRFVVGEVFNIQVSNPVPSGFLDALSDAGLTLNDIQGERVVNHWSPYWFAEGSGQGGMILYTNPTIPTSTLTWPPPMPAAPVADNTQPQGLLEEFDDAFGGSGFGDALEYEAALNDRKAVKLGNSGSTILGMFATHEKGVNWQIHTPTGINFFKGDKIKISVPINAMLESRGAISAFAMELGRSGLEFGDVNGERTVTNFVPDFMGPGTGGRLFYDKCAYHPRSAVRYDTYSGTQCYYLDKRLWSGKLL